MFLKTFSKGGVRYVMDIIVINECKLKIMLGKEELDSFGISAESLDYSNTETKHLLWDLLDRAKHETGFDTDGQRILVQLYPSRDGGCEMFITKMGSLSPKKDTKEDEDMATVHITSKSAQTAHKRTRTFGFERTEWLMSVCRRLYALGYEGESSAHFCDDGRSYLMLSETDTFGFVSLDELSFITEYGTCENTDAVKCFVGEHGKTVCENNAVALLGAL